MMKRNIQEQSIDARAEDGKVIINGHKYRLSMGGVSLYVKELVPSNKNWQITAGVMKLGILLGKETKTIHQDAVQGIVSKIGASTILLKDKQNKEYKLVKEDKMKKIVKLTESDLNNLVRKVLEEQREENYMFFSNLEQMKRQIDSLLEMDPSMVDEIIQNGHDWADDHVSEAKTNMDQVFDFLMNETRKMKSYIDYEDINEGRKKTGTKLCARGKSAAKAKFKVYPSAYSNGYGVQVCKGDIAGLDGKKHCSGSYC